MDLNLNLIYIETFPFHYFIAEILIDQWSEVSNNIFMQEYKNDKVNVMLGILMKSCGDDVFQLILKFLCPIFTRDVGFEYLEII